MTHASRRRLCSLLIAALAAAAVGMGPRATRGRAATTTPTLTRVRATVSSTAAWASFRLAGGTLRAWHASQTTVGTKVTVNNGLVTLSNATPFTAVIDEVFDVPATASPTLRVDKATPGTATVDLTRTNTTATPILRVTDDRQASTDNLLVVDVDRGTLVGEGLPLVPIDPRHLTLAFYYPWFDGSSFSHGLWMDRPTGPYDTTDPAQVSAMVQQAAGAGISGFVVDWDRRHGPQLDLVVHAAEAQRGFTTTVYLELPKFRLTTAGGLFSRLDTEALLRDTAAVLQRAASPAFLRVGGRPVLFAFGVTGTTPTEWHTYRDRLRAAGLNPFIIGDTADPSYELDGTHLYNPNAYSGDELATQYTAAITQARLFPAIDPTRHQMLWAATVSPGEDDRLVRPLQPTYRSRDGGHRYDQTWQLATAPGPEWVLITSWNEWYETTNVAPGTTTGTRALDQTRTWTRRFSGG